MTVATEPSSSGNTRERIQQAKNGCQQTLADLLRDAQSYLKTVAVAAIDPDVQGKMSASDIVQDTLTDAHQHFHEFRGEDGKQLLAWLRRILVNNVLNQYRRLRNTQKRDVSREQHVEIDHLIATKDETPSRVAMNHEEGQVLAEELARLPDHYRQVVELRHRDQLSFHEIGERLKKSEDAVRMIWYRAFERLSEALSRRLG